MTFDTRPILAEPDRRYWRSRANRQVRTRRRTRTALRMSRLVAMQVLIAGFLFYAGYRVFSRIITAEEFALERIEIAGTHRASTDALQQRLAHFLGRNVLDLNLHGIAAETTRDPWVMAAAARRILPRTVRLTVQERRPVAAAMIDGTAYVIDATGFVVGPSGPGMADDLPVLTGLDGLERHELVDTLARGVKLVARLRETVGPWMESVSELNLARVDRIELRTIDPGPRLLLDPERVDRNLWQYLELRREIERRVGRADYVDLRWQGRIAVMPAETG